MNCKDCGKFKPENRIEAGKELTPKINSLKGKCSENNKNCMASDSCGCGGFTEK